MEFDLEILEEAFSKSPKAVLEYFKSLGIVIKDEEKFLEEIEKDAFYITKVTKLDLLLDIKKEIEDAIENGTSFKDFKDNFRNILERRGYYDDTGKGINTNWRINLIYKQNIIKSYSAGRYFQSQEYKNDFPYYVNYSVLDKTTTPACTYLNNKVVRIDDPKINLIYPPGHFRCRRIMIPVEYNFVISKGYEIVSVDQVQKHWNKPSFQKLPTAPFAKDFTAVPNDFKKEFDDESND